MHPVIIRLACLALGLGILSGCSSAPKPQAPADLQVSVDLSAVWHPMVDDDVAEAIGNIVRTEFRRQGYTGSVVYLRRGEHAAPDIPLLALHVDRWRITRTDMAECVLSAKLRTSAGETDLGLVQSNEFTWLGTSGRVGGARQFEVAEAFEKSAARAIRDLYRRLADTELVAGLTREIPR